MPDTSGSQSAFLEGVPIRTSASAYLEASVPRITQYALEVLAQPDNAEPRITQYALEVLIRPFNSTPAFLAGTDTSTDSQAAYLKGSSPSTDNIPAFLSGISTLQTDSQSAYIYGQATTTDATPAFTEGFQDFLSGNTPAYLYGAGEILFPIGDISQSGSWQREDTSTSNLYVSIDEDPGPNDSDYVWHDNPVVDNYFEVSLDDPQYISITAGEVKVFWRAKRLAGTQSMSIKVELREGVSVKASDSQALTDNYKTYAFALTQGERDSISDWTDLRLRFTVESIT